MTAPAPSRPHLPGDAAWISRTAASPSSSTAPRGGDASSERTETPSDRRLLLLTAAYPPRTEVGAARWEGFTPFLVAAGWGIDVVIEHPRDLASPDFARLNRLPADVRVAATPRKRPDWHAALLRARAALGGKRASGRRAGAVEGPPIPVTTVVASRGGLREAVREVIDTAVLAQQSRQCAADFADVALALTDPRHRVVVSSGPPHYVHVAARRVAEQRGLAHVVDLRDPWARTSPATPLERLLPDPELRGRERETLERAALVVTNTDAAARALGDRFPALRPRIRCIPNGSDLPPIAPPSRDRRPALFQIAHCGSLYLDRDPRPFLRAVGRFRSRLGLSPHELRVVFMGLPARIGGRSLMELAAEAGIGDIFEERPPDTRDAARDLLRRSAVGVAFQGETRTQVPAKVFEYMAFPLWLLALVGSDSATAELLAGSEAIVHDIDDEAGTERSLERCYAAFRSGEVPRPVGHDGRYSRQRQAGRLIDELEKLPRTEH